MPSSCTLEVRGLSSPFLQRIEKYVPGTLSFLPGTNRQVHTYTHRTHPALDSCSVHVCQPPCVSSHYMCACPPLMAAGFPTAFASLVHVCVILCMTPFDGRWLPLALASLGEWRLLYLHACTCIRMYMPPFDGLTQVMFCHCQISNGDGKKHAESSSCGHHVHLHGTKDYPLRAPSFYLKRYAKELENEETIDEIIAPVILFILCYRGHSRMPAGFYVGGERDSYRQVFVKLGKKLKLPLDFTKETWLEAPPAIQVDVDQLLSLSKNSQNQYVQNVL